MLEVKSGAGEDNYDEADREHEGACCAD
jgi:hypothetical protein